MAVAGDGAVAKGGGKAVKQKQAVKPSKPEAVITISPDTEEEAKDATLKNSHGNSSKKKVHTLTSVLTARSKVKKEPAFFPCSFDQ